MDVLPSEVLTEIFKYLSFRDRQQMALVNSKWYHASTHPEFLLNELFYYSEIKDHFDRTYENNSLPMFYEFQRMLLNSKRKHFNLKFFGSLYVRHVFPIFTNLANRILSVQIIGVNKLTDSLLDVILNCSKLEVLELSWIPYFTITNIPRQPILSLKRISFETSDLSDNNFNAIIQCAPHLEDLGLVNCNILTWRQAIKRFYPNYTDSEVVQTFNSNDIFTNVNIINYLKTAKYIKKLRLGNNFHIFLELPDNIKLVYLKLSLIGPWSTLNREKYDELSNKLANQSTLETLNIESVPCCVLVPCIPLMVNLKSLKVKYLNVQCDNQSPCEHKILESLVDKKKLRELTLISLSYEITILPNIAKSTLFPLTSFKGQVDSDFNVMNVCVNLTNLKIINGNIISSSGYKLLFKNLINLRKLVINNCHKLDDNVLSCVPISNLKALRVMRLFNSKLTYKCFKYIQNSELREIFIKDISLKKCIKLNNMSDFVKVLEKFSGFVPELTQLKLCVKEGRNKKNFEVLKQIEFLRGSIQSYFEKMKSLIIQI